MLHHGFHAVIKCKTCMFVCMYVCMHNNMQVCILYLHLICMHAVCYQRVFIYTSFDLHIIVFIRTCHCKCIIEDCFECKWSVICWINHHTKSEGKCNNLAIMLLIEIIALICISSYNQLHSSLLLFHNYKFCTNKVYIFLFNKIELLGPCT